jgi:hypothetical protein
MCGENPETRIDERLVIIAIILALNVVMFGGGFVVGQLSTQTLELAAPITNIYYVAGYVNETVFNMAWNITHTNITTLAWYNDSFISVIGINSYEKDPVSIRVYYNCDMVNPSIRFDGVIAYYGTNTTVLGDLYNQTFAPQGIFDAVNHITIIFFGHGVLKEINGLAASGALTIGVDWYE